MTHPLVTICIPVFNMVKTVEDSVRSVLAQSFTEWNLLIVDNASTDGSRELAEKLAGEDCRISIACNNHTVPMVENYNNCLKHSKGEFLNILSADDLLHTDFLKESMDVFKFNSNLGYVATSHNYIDENGQTTHKPSFYKASAIIPGTAEAEVNLAGNHSAPSYMLYNRKALMEAGGFPSRFPCCFDIHTKLSLNLISDVGYIAKSLCHYRVTSQSGPSLYRGNDFSPLFELYQIKMKILSEFTVGEGKRMELAERIKGNLSRVSIALAEFAWSVKGDTEISRSYLNFAMAFNPHISSNPKYQELSAALGDAHTHSKPEKGTGTARPPFKLPAGSILFKP